jgi:protein-S-isoprenylcysteine O-methyltransferase Ste14
MSSVSRDRPPWSAVIGTIVAASAFIGVVLGWVPYALCGWVARPSLFFAARYLGVALIAPSLPILLAFLVRFVVEGHGTPAPMAPPRRLVVGGPFRYVRNPSYVAGTAAVAGQGLLFGSTAVLTYAACLAFGFHLFVVLYEEPTLRGKFGAAYEEYCRQVPR